MLMPLVPHEGGRGGGATGRRLVWTDPRVTWGRSAAPAGHRSCICFSSRYVQTEGTEARWGREHRGSLCCACLCVCVCACPCVCASVRAHHLFVFLAPFPSTSQGGSPSWPPGCAADLVGPVLPASWLVAGLLPSGPLVRDQLLTVRRFLFSFGRKAVSSGAPGMGSRAGSVTEKGVQMLCAGLTGTRGGARGGGALASGGGQEALHARRAAPGEGGAPRQGMNVS